MTLIQHNVKFAWTLFHQAAFVTLKGTFIQAPILHYSGPSKHYIVYTDVLDDTYRAQLYQEHDGQELPVAFLSLTFMDIQCK